MAGRRTGLLAPGVWVGRTFPGLCVIPSGRRRWRPRPPRPGHSGGTAPVSHRTSLEHRPYGRRQSIRLTALGRTRAVAELRPLREIGEIVMSRLRRPPALAGPRRRHPRPVRRPRRHRLGGGPDRRPRRQAQVAARQPPDRRLAAGEPAAPGSDPRRPHRQRHPGTGAERRPRRNRRRRQVGRHRDPRPGGRATRPPSTATRRDARKGPGSSRGAAGSCGPSRRR